MFPPPGTPPRRGLSRAKHVLSLVEGSPRRQVRGIGFSYLCVFARVNPNWFRRLFCSPRLCGETFFPSYPSCLRGESSFSSINRVRGGRYSELFLRSLRPLRLIILFCDLFFGCGSAALAPSLSSASSRHFLVRGDRRSRSWLRLSVKCSNMSARLLELELIDLRQLLPL